MKKKILFVIPSLRSGGAEKSLVSLLSLFDYEKYEVDLLLFRRDGLFLEKLPREINYIYDTSDYEMFDGDIKEAVNYFIRKFNFSAALDRIRYTKAFSENDVCVRERILWNYLKKHLPKIEKKYDCAIGYLEGNANSFVSESVDCGNKILYIHNDLKKLEHDHEVYENTLSAAKKIVTVSDVCLRSLLEEFPNLAEKMCVIENITSRKLIRESAEEEKVFDKKEGTVLLTVGRCSPQKNIELAADACNELKSRGRKIKWYHIGKGENAESVRSYAEKLGLKDDFIMLGEKSNPYPYMAQCDIYVQPSRFEGKSIAIDEVKCLCKPIVVTDFPSVYDQITDGENGLICRMNETDMADKIEMIMDSEELRNKVSANLEKEKPGNEEEIYKLYDLIEK